MLLADLSPEWISAVGALVSAVFAGIAVVASIVIYCKTRNLLKPTECPIFTVVDCSCSTTIKPDKSCLELTIVIQFKNVGKHPAENITTTVWAAPLDKPGKLHLIRHDTNANRIEPETTFNSWLKGTYRTRSPNDLTQTQQATLFLYYELRYFDAYQPTTAYFLPLYFKHKIGTEIVNHASVEEKNKFSDYLKNLKPPAPSTQGQNT